MVEHSLIFRDIAMVFTAASLCGLVAWRLKQPILLGYVVAGLLLIQSSRPNRAPTPKLRLQC